MGICVSGPNSKHKKYRELTYGWDKEEVKIMVAGAGGVGKTSLVRRFTDGDWYEDYDPGIEDAYRKLGIS